MAQAAGWGERLRSRAREMGLADAEVARRVGLAQRRYSTYVNETRQPDFDTLVRICLALDTTPDRVLGVRDGADMPDSTAAMARAVGALRALPASALELAAGMLHLLAEHVNAAGQEDQRP